ncbi:MAG: RNA methyltransferase [Bacteroidetes bacterium]|nr:RNA methyltransferase [Bacteroidota bacterium]
MRKLSMQELNRLDAKEFRSVEKTPVVVVLDNVKSMNNIGSVFRTCDAFRIEAIYLCGFTATPPHREIHKTALGATESVGWKYFKETRQALEELKENGYLLIALEQTDKSILLNNYQPDCKSRSALIFGNEVKGVHQEVLDMCDLALEIPQYGTKHSFNIAVSAGIVLWDLFVKINFPSNNKGAA